VRVGRHASDPGATIVLYTDGLVEERGHSIDAGIGRVAAAIAAHGADDAGELADAVLRDVGARGDLDDDVALLVVRFTELGETRSGAVAGDVSVVRAGP